LTQEVFWYPSDINISSSLSFLISFSLSPYNPHHASWIAVDWIRSFSKANYEICGASWPDNPPPNGWW